MSFDSNFQQVIMVEGGYSNDPHDPGGKTRWGITENVARAHGYKGDMKDLPLETAKTIYKSAYWDTLRLDQVDALNEDIAHELFDTSVNMGVGIAGRFLQRALTGLNRIGKDFPDLLVDGIIGPVTIFGLQTFLNLRGANGVQVVLRALNGQQLTRYLEIEESRPTSEDYLFGWILQRVK